jgi:hypothetical protein
VDTFAAGSIALLVYTLFWTSMAVSLLVVHIYLISTGQTMYEMMRPLPRSDQKKFRFNGAMANFLILCHPLTESLYREKQAKLYGKRSTVSSKEVSPKDFHDFARKMFAGSQEQAAGVAADSDAPRQSHQVVIEGQKHSEEPSLAFIAGAGERHGLASEQTETIPSLPNSNEQPAMNDADAVQITVT